MLFQIGSEESPETWSRFGFFGVEDTSLPGLSGRSLSLSCVGCFFFPICDEGGDRTLLRQCHNYVWWMSFSLDFRFAGAKGAGCFFPELKFRCCWLHESTSMTPIRVLEDLKKKEHVSYWGAVWNLNRRKFLIVCLYRVMSSDYTWETRESPDFFKNNTSDLFILKYNGLFNVFHSSKCFHVSKTHISPSTLFDSPHHATKPKHKTWRCWPRKEVSL